ncbi:MAG: hypothetical protein QOF44_5405 [Streptomyces sp.]|nr:hypothetical protein [Streptomyces sp.]
MSHPPRAQHTRTARCRALAATSIKAFLATATLASALLIAGHLLSGHSTVSASATTAENGADHAEAPDATAVCLTSVSSPLPRNDGKTTNGAMTVSPSAATYGTGVRSGRARTMIPVVGSSDATPGNRLARSDFPIRDSMSVGTRRLTEQSEANETRCSRQPGPVDYRDPNQAGLSGQNVGGGSSWLVQVGPIGVDLNASDLNAGDTKSRCARHLKSLGRSAKESDCGCGTPSPGGWGYNPWAPPTPPRTQPGHPSAYYPPGYSPTSYYPHPYPNGAVPNLGHPNTPDQYTAVPNAYPNATYPNGHYPAGTDPFGYGPPSYPYRHTGTNPCAPSPDYGPASYPVIDSSGRLICPTTPVNASTPPGVGVHLDGW